VAGGRRPSVGDQAGEDSQGGGNEKSREDTPTNAISKAVDCGDDDGSQEQAAAQDRLRGRQEPLALTEADRERP